MSFRIMYYVSTACPTVERTKEMVDLYVENGVDFFQFDLPSSDPYAETDYMKQVMKQALEINDDYDYYMDAIRAIRRQYPGIDISMVVYSDVVQKIGLEKFVLFLKEIGAVYSGIADMTQEDYDCFDKYGVSYFNAVSYSDPEYDLERLVEKGVTENDLIGMRTRRRVETINRKCDSWADRVKMVREYGIQSKLYAVADIKTKDDMIERRDAGMDGAIVGNILMNKWDDREALLEVLHSFQSCAIKENKEMEED